MNVGGAIGHVAAAGLALLGAEFVGRQVFEGRSAQVRTALGPAMMTAAGLVGVATASGFVRSVATGVALNGALHLAAQGAFAANRSWFERSNDLWAFVEY